MTSAEFVKIYNEVAGPLDMKAETSLNLNELSSPTGFSGALRYRR